MMYRTSNTTQKTARAKIKMPYIKNASWLVIISGNKVFGSAELSGVDSGSGLVELFSGSDAMVDALKAIKKGCAIVCLQLTRFKSKKLLLFGGKNVEPIFQNSLATIMATKSTTTFLKRFSPCQQIRIFLFPRETCLNFSPASRFLDKILQRTCNPNVGTQIYNPAVGWFDHTETLPP